MQIRNNVEFNKNQALNMLLQIIAGNHGSPVEGIVWYDSGSKVIKYHDGTSVITLASGGSGVSPNTWDAQSLVGAVSDNTPIAITFAASTIFGRKSTGDIGSMSIAQLVTELLAADGAGSFLDADLLDGQEGTYYLALANATGGAATIPDFAEAVSDQVGGMFTGNTETGVTVTYQDADNTIDVVVGTLDTLPAPTGSLSLNSQKITSLATPTADTDAATKGYVDSVAQGLSAKTSVRVATTAAITLATGAENADVIDGVTLATGDRILVKNQAAGAENGIYTVNASGAPTRATDFDLAAEVQAGAYFFVEEGTTNANTGWVLTTDGAITVGTTTLAFEQFSGAGQITAGAALTKTGNTLDVAVAAGAGGIEVSSDALRISTAAAGAGLTGGGGSALAIDTAVVARKYSTTVGNGSLTTITVTHSLGTEDVIVQCRLAGGTKEAILVDWKPTSTSAVDLTFSVAPTSNEIRVTVLG